MNLKHKRVKKEKVICFECKSYATINKDGTCAICKSSEIYVSLPSVRIPRKGRDREWKELHEMAKASIGRTPWSDERRLLGFWKGTGFGSPKYKKKVYRLTSGIVIVKHGGAKLPKSIREKAHRANALAYIKTLPLHVVDCSKPL